jgi:hypothetical protein
MTGPKNLNEDGRYGPDPAEWRPEYDDAYAESTCGFVKRWDDPTVQPGDIITFGLDGIKHGRPSDYGYIEVATRRQLRQRKPRLWSLRILYGWVRGMR